jgi:hypothetical protein
VSHRLHATSLKLAMPPTNTMQTCPPCTSAPLCMQDVASRQKLLALTLQACLDVCGGSYKPPGKQGIFCKDLCGQHFLPPLIKLTGKIR